LQNLYSLNGEKDGLKMEANDLSLFNETRLLKATEVAKILNISRALAYQLMQQRRIDTVHIRGACRVRPADLKKFIEENITPAEKW
jgi:excisionase family DNA binding protein